MERTAYQYGTCPMTEVMANVGEYIIPENQAACELLWSKNIFTTMTNTYDNEHPWIEISCLSPENQEMFDKLKGLAPNFVGYVGNGIGFKLPEPVIAGSDTYTRFAYLIDCLAAQDVQKDGCMSGEEFLRDYCGCYKIITNPNYVLREVPKVEDYETEEDYMKALVSFNQATCPKSIRVFDESKMIMSFEDYLANSKFAKWYDPDVNRIYYNDMYYQAHLAYKNGKLTRAMH